MGQARGEPGEDRLRLAAEDVGERGPDALVGDVRDVAQVRGDRVFLNPLCYFVFAVGSWAFVLILVGIYDKNRR